MSQYTTPRFDTSVLVTIDTQNDFTLPGAPACIEGTREIVPAMVRLLAGYRQKAMPVVHVIRLYQPDGSNVDVCRREAVEKGRTMVAPHSAGAELVREIRPDGAPPLDANVLLDGAFQQIGENEYVMYKPRWGAFYGTVLASFLRERGVDTLVFCGCNYPNCPRTSIYEASERDLRVVLASDAVSGLYPRGETEMKNIGVNLWTTNEILAALG